MSTQPPKILNVAIIAHVDHGKTTLVDEMLKQSGTAGGDVDRVMDSKDLEKERGITILAKNTSILYKDTKINIVDTPGHMDFGGEVERTLQMVEGFILLVDAAEGPLPGTRFVLRKALELNLKPMVIINKIDRKDADIDRTEELVHDLFLDVACNDDQLEFKTLYGSSKLGFMSEKPSATEGDFDPLFQSILTHIPAPKINEEHLQFLVTNLDYSDYLGRIAIGRIFSGKISVNDQVVVCKGEKISRPFKVTQVYQFKGLDRVESQEGLVGDIIAVTGFDEEIGIGVTLCDVEHPLPLPYKEIDEPTLSMNFLVNTSPFCGKEGNLLTSRQIRDRLDRELKTNLALRVEDTDTGDTFKVSGRGQLHLGVLVEEMRREGFELQLSAPEVIYKNIDGKKHEPYELLILDLEEAYQGIMMEKLGTRKAILENMTPYGDGKIRLEFKIPARGLIGFRSQFLTDTRGTGMMNHQYLGYFPYSGDLARRNKGAIASMEGGKVTAYSLDNLQSRGVLFVGPGVNVYEGMIIGENSRDNDLDVNPVKGKKLTNMRTSGTDEAAKLTPPKIMTLEVAMDWINEDELIEVTPKNIRLRKSVLKAGMRKRK